MAKTGEIEQISDDNHDSGLGIRFRLACLVAACVLPVLIGSGFLVSQSYRLKRELMDRDMLHTARALTQVVDRELGNMEASLTVLATSPSLDSGDLKAFHHQAQMVLREYEGGDIILADASGQQLVNSFRPFGTQLPRRGVHDEVRRVYATGKPSIANLFRGSVTGRPLIGVDVPVIRDGRVIYDLAMTLPADRIAAILEQQYLPPDWIGSILDGDQTVVARTRLPERFVGSHVTPALQLAIKAGAGTSEFTNLEGTLVINSFTHSPMSGWTVVIGVPKSIFMAEVWRWLWWMIAATVLLSTVGIWLAVLIARSVARIEEALRHNREWLRVTLSSIGDAVLTTDTKGRITFLNPVAADLTGWQPSEAEGKPFQSVFGIINEQTRVAPEDLVSRVLKERQAVELANHTALLARDGREIPIEDSAAPIWDKSGNIVGVVIVFHDVMERRRTEEALRQSEAQLQLFIEYAPAGLAMFDKQMRYLHSSHRWMTDYHLGDRDLRGLSHYEVFPDIPEQWKENHRRGLAGEVVRSEGERFERVAGSAQWVRWEIRPWRDAKGEVGGIVILSEDITERKQAEQRIAHLASFPELNANPIVESDLEGKITYANPAAQQQHLMPRETGVGHPLLEDWPSVVASLKAGPERSTVREVENDGRIFLQRIHYLRDLEVIRSYYTDITELKQAEDLLRQSQSEAVLATLADFVPQMVWMCMPDGLNVYFNHRWVEYTGLTLEESYGRGWNTPFHPDDKQAAWDAWNHAVKTGEQYHVESRLQAADGTYRWFLMRGAPLRDDAGEIVRWFGTCTDIEELKQAGQTLLVAQRKLTETVVNQLPCCVALVRGCDLTFQLVNPGYRAISPDREMLGKSIQEVWPEKPGFEELCRGVLETGIPYFAVDEPSPVSRSSGGQPVLAYFSWSMYRVDLPGEDGRGLLITEWETTERKQADEALRSSQAKLQSIVGSAMDAVISVDERQRIVLFNQAAETVFQCPASEALGSTLDRFIPELLREVHREHIRRFGTEGISQRSMTSPAVLAGVRTNGEEFPIEATVSQVEADGEKLYTVILRDITGRKQAEQALLRSEKLASVGRMAATIAHEINNPLAATTNALYIAMSQKDLTETTRHYLEAADSELRRIAHITRQSLGFYREFNAPALTSVNAVLESAVDLLKSKIRTKQAVIEKEWDEDVEVVAVAGELRQVFANLLANSLDAIGQKGRIKLRVSAGSVPKNGHRCVRVTIADNGSGISAASRQHLFEPFFTTKGTIGTGLGLWVSKQIVDKHEGTIRVRSSASGLCTGTVFSLVLPAEPTKAVRKQSAGGLS